MMTFIDGSPALSPYLGYPYAYPHKTAYDHFSPPISLERLWAQENKQSLFLYFHVPFCGRRCNFCNLFSMRCPQPEMADAYLETVKRQASVVIEAMQSASFARIAIGGGTPTFLNTGQLTTLFHICRDIVGADPKLMPTSVEVSPATASPERLSLLKSFGVDRISIGIQSFLPNELAVLGRVDDYPVIPQALDNIRSAGFTSCNIDLIYGIPGQTMASWLDSLETAVAQKPEELYLYPLYVRPLTPMAQVGQAENDLRPGMYRAARARLIDAGFRQASMRMFRAPHVSEPQNAPKYTCQEDGMLGLGCGPRSYTQSVHYAAPYAASQHHIQKLLQQYIAHEAHHFRNAWFGIHLNLDEQKRRFLIKSLLKADGFAVPTYERRFEADLFEDFPEVVAFIDRGWALHDHGTLQLTDTGMAYSDTIGPMFYSQSVIERMKTYRLR